MKIGDCIRQLEQIRKDQGLVTLDMTSLELVQYLKYLRKQHGVKEVPGVLGWHTSIVVGKPGARVRPIRGTPPRQSKKAKK